MVRCRQRSGTFSEPRCEVWTYDFYEAGAQIHRICPGQVWIPSVEKLVPETASALHATEEEVIRYVLLPAQPTKTSATVGELAALAVLLC